MGQLGATLDIMCKDINKFREKSGQIEKKITKQLGELVRKDVDNLFKAGIDDFYEAYTPIYYNRKKALYDCYIISIRGDYLTIQSNGTYMPAVHRADNNYIYDLVFVQGYHGGAWDADGSPKWRTPGPDVGKGAYQHIGRSAVQTESPNDIICNYIDDYNDSGIVQQYAELIAVPIINSYLTFL